MELVEVKGKKIIVSSRNDLLDIIRENCGDDVYKLLTDPFFEYDYESMYIELLEQFNALEKEYLQLMERR